MQKNHPPLELKEVFLYGCRFPLATQVSHVRRSFPDTNAKQMNLRQDNIVHVKGLVHHNRRKIA